MYAEYAYYTEEGGRIRFLRPGIDLDEERAHIGYLLRIRLDLVTKSLRIPVPEAIEGKPVELIVIIPELHDDRPVPRLPFPLIKYLYVPSGVRHLPLSAEILRTSAASSDADGDKLNVLNGCTVEISPDNPNFCVYRQGIYSKSMKKLYRIFSPGECFEIPEGVEEICGGAGCALKGLKKLVVPKSVKEIGNRAFEGCADLEEAEILSENIGARAFYGCRRLSSLTIKGAKVIFKDAFGDCRGHDEILKNAFKVCVDPKKYKCVIDEDGHFELSLDCEDIIQPQSGDSKHSILGNSPFLENKHLKKLTLSNIKNVCFGAFSSCEDLEELIIENAEKIGQFAFISCYSLRNIKAECKELYGSAFNSCKTLENVTLRNTEIIHGGAFSHCEGLKEIVLPDTLREIGDYTFYKTGIERLAIPLSVRRLGKEILSGGTIEIASVNGGFFLTCEEIMHAGGSGVTLAVKDAEKGEILYELDLSYNISEVFLERGINFDAYKNSDDRFSGYKSSLFSARSSLRHIPDPGGRVYEPLRQYVSDLTALDVLEKIDNGDQEILSEYRFYDDIEIKRFLNLIDYSARKGNAEITAALLMKMNERRDRE